MIGILRAKLYRFNRQKSSFVILVVAAVIAFFLAFSVGSLLGNSNFALNMQMMMKESFGNSGSIYNQAMFSEILEMIEHYQLGSVSAFLSIGLSGDILYVLFLFIIFFSNATIRNGFIKTVLPNVRRTHLFFADAVFLLIYTVLLVLIYLTVFSLTTPIFFVDVPFGNIFSFVVFVILKILLLFVSGLCIIVTCDFFVKRPRMIIFSALYITILSGFLYAVLDVVVQLFFGSGASSSYIVPIGALNMLRLGDTVSYISGTIVSVLYLLLCILLEVLVIPKKDLI